MAHVEPPPAAGDRTLRTGQARWSRLAGLGLIMAGIAPLLMLAAGLLWGLEFEGDAAFFIVTGLLGIVSGILVSRFGLWSKVVGIIASILLLGALFWTVFGLMAPQSFFDVVPGLLLIPGALIGLICSIAAIRAHRRNDVPATADRGEARGLRLFPTIVIVLAVISAALTFFLKETVEGEGDAQVTLSDFEFDKASYSFAPGTEIVVTNDDPFMHTFTIEELDIDETLNPGSQVKVTIPEESGDYTVFCRPHTMDPKDPQDDDMAADLSVE